MLTGEVQTKGGYNARAKTLHGLKTGPSNTIPRDATHRRTNAYMGT
jgi:hypothetical protein